MTLREALRNGSVSQDLVSGWFLSEGNTGGLTAHLKAARNAIILLAVFCLLVFATSLVSFYYPGQTWVVLVLVLSGICTLIFSLSLAYCSFVERKLLRDLRSLYEHLGFDLGHRSNHPFDPDDLFEFDEFRVVPLRSSIEDRAVEIAVLILLNELLLCSNGSSEPVSIGESNRRYRARKAAAVGRAELHEFLCLCCDRFRVCDLDKQWVFDQARSTIDELSEFHSRKA